MLAERPFTRVVFENQTTEEEGERLNCFIRLNKLVKNSQRQCEEVTRNFPLSPYKYHTNPHLQIHLPQRYINIATNLNLDLNL